MCGIAGIVDFGRPIDPAHLDEMLKLIVHRGPDDEGRYHQGPFSVGMRRLSIIDLGGGHQPIANEDMSVWVVLNGEIYNYVELREDLEKRGHVFSTRTDTEVLVHLYEEHGDAFPEKLNGMFGLAVWDLRKRRILLARDHLGIKPLYWRFASGRLSFASELKCILASGIPRPEIDRAAIATYLHLGYIPHDRSPFTGIQKLQPGWRLVFDEGGSPRVGRYWTLAESFHRSFTGTVDEAAEEVRGLLRDAVRIQLRSDVPVGTFLSGGIDSSSITAVAASLLPQIDTFGVGFTDHYFDETEYARLVARHVGSRHHEQQVDPRSLVAHLEKLSWHLDEPNSDPAMLPSYMICRYAREHVKVVLSGNGGDEVFAGYPRHYDPPPRASRADRLRELLPRPIRRALQSALRFVDAEKARRLATDNDVIGLSYWAELARPQVAAKVAPWAMEAFSVLDWIESVYAPVAAQDWVNRRLYYDSTTYMPDQILNMVDRASMAVSLEVRVPLLDVRLVEFMAGVEGALKIETGAGKRILKRAMSGLLPEEIFTRRKLGFGLPVVRWIEAGPVKAILDELPHGHLVRDGFVNGPALEPLLREPAVLKGDWTFFWNLIMLELWLAQYVHQERRPAR